MSKPYRPPKSWRKTLENVLTNLDAPMPLHQKVFVMGRNYSIRLVKQSSCCGHPGEPGC